MQKNNDTNNSKTVCCCEQAEVETECCNKHECCRSTVRSEEDKRCLTSRINRIIGQLGGIKNMIAQDRYCDDILIQLSAIDKSVKSLANAILDAHMHTCLVDNIKNGNLTVLDEIVDLFKRFQ